MEADVDQQDINIMIEESVLYEHNPKCNFVMLECEKIVGRDYVMGLAVERAVNAVVSIKEYLGNECGVVSEELYAYQVVEKCMGLESPPVCFQNILALYQIQKS